jgi:hypothetical protein
MQKTTNFALTGRLVSANLSLPSIPLFAQNRRLTPAQVVNSFVFVQILFVSLHNTLFVFLNQTTQPITCMFGHMVGMDKAHCWYQCFSRLDEVKLNIGLCQILKWPYITYYWTYRVDTWTSWPISGNRSPEVTIKRAFAVNLVIDPELIFKRSSKVTQCVTKGHLG